MIIPTCQKCRSPIPAEDTNVAADVAFCRRCNLATKLSSLVHELGPVSLVDLDRPPAGCWMRSSWLGTTIGVSHRSAGAAAAALLVMLFWNGIVSVFVLLATAGTLNYLGVAAPEWFPAPNKGDELNKPGMLLFLWIFLTPFIAIGFAMFCGFLMALFGKTELTLRGSEAVLRTGVGPFSYRRRFNSGFVRSVRIQEQNWSDSKGRRQEKTFILIEDEQGKQIKLGSSLPNERRRFLAAALQKSLLGQSR